MGQWDRRFRTIIWKIISFRSLWHQYRFFFLIRNLQSIDKNSAKYSNTQFMYTKHRRCFIEQYYSLHSQLYSYYFFWDLNCSMLLPSAILANADASHWPLRKCNICFCPYFINYWFKIVRLALSNAPTRITSKTLTQPELCEQPNHT